MAPAKETPLARVRAIRIVTVPTIHAPATFANETTKKLVHPIMNVGMTTVARVTMFAKGTTDWVVQTIRIAYPVIVKARTANVPRRTRC